jgi:hypothetical protein
MRPTSSTTRRSPRSTGSSASAPTARSRCGRVTKPHQKLEELFLDIVEQAQQRAPSWPSPRSPSADVVADLMGEEQTPEPEPSKPRAAPSAPSAPAPESPAEPQADDAEVDRSLIDSLLDNDGDEERSR